MGTLNLLSQKRISKLPTQKYEHNQEKIMTDKDKEEGFNKISNKQPCPTIKSKMTTKYLTCSKSVSNHLWFKTKLL